MLKKYTHKEFEDFLKNYGVNLVHITRKKVYVVPPDIPSYWWPKGVIPRDKWINLNKKFLSYDQEYRSTNECIDQDRKIQVIKNIRAMVPDMDLRQAVNFVNVNFYGDPTNVKDNE